MLLTQTKPLHQSSYCEALLNHMVSCPQQDLNFTINFQFSQSVVDLILEEQVIKYSATRQVECHYTSVTFGIVQWKVTITAIPLQNTYLKHRPFEV